MFKIGPDGHPSFLCPDRPRRCEWLVSAPTERLTPPAPVEIVDYAS